ncbi:hypothetical protein SAMN02745130_01251 [Thiothrix eikelboomii]|uniref:Pectate lyase n=1 Tax=Thiothrix eikelboomii TaxID=92487 RepID=A0A1T4W8T5_9GAMM|nr:hypothetical protein [Thiothrix eikelboomii]SKA73607.1 hypothetical protein SAMN02745130_01251 [Thiothrix eikelboomii]
MNQGIFWLIWLYLIAIPAYAGLPAFPGAEGAGADSLGGRGGQVLVVDRLDDPCPTKACSTADLADPHQLIPGTLRWALMQPYPRTVVFRVSGVIELLKDELTWNEKTQQVDIQRLGNIRITSPYLTVAGQTAPAGGITIKNNGVSILTHDVQLRYLRFRTGRQLPVFAGQQTPETLMLSNQARAVMIDHCSFSWMPAEGVSVYTGELWDGSKGTATDLTLSWNLIGEGLVRHEDGRGHPSAAFMSGYDGDPKYAADRLSLHHNLLVHSQKRNGDLLTKQGQLINNLIYNWQWLPTVLAGAVKADVIGNTWKAGPITAADYDQGLGGLHLVPAARERKQQDPDGWWDGLPGDPSLFLKDNRYLVAGEPTSQQLLCHYQERKQACSKRMPIFWFRPQALTTHGVAITVQTAVEAEKSVLAQAGASQRINSRGQWVNNRDVIDQRYVDDYRMTRYINKTFPFTESEVGGFPVQIEGELYPDTDRDGISDHWEQVRGLNPADASDAKQPAAGQGGYTWLELFINGAQ